MTNLSFEIYKVSYKKKSQSFNAKELEQNSIFIIKYINKTQTRRVFVVLLICVKHFFKIKILKLNIFTADDQKEIIY